MEGNTPAAEIRRTAPAQGQIGAAAILERTARHLARSALIQRHALIAPGSPRSWAAQEPSVRCGRVPCAKTVPEPISLLLLGLALSEKQIPQLTENAEKP